jgi:hypothetical protein
MRLDFDDCNTVTNQNLFARNVMSLLMILGPPSRRFNCLREEGSEDL